MVLEEKPESGVILEFQTQYYPLLPFLCILAAGENEKRRCEEDCQHLNGVWAGPHQASPCHRSSL